MIAAIQTILLGALIGSWLIADWFTGSGFDDSVVYHLRFGAEGAGISEFIPQIIYFSLIVLTSIVIAGVFLHISKKTSSDKRTIISTSLAFILLFFSWFINPAFLNIGKYFYTTKMGADFQLYTLPAPTLPTVKQPKNVLFFYLEGLERTYLDPELFPDLLPNLRKLEEGSISFTQIEQTIGASWTIAGMVASQCGLPLLTIFTNTDFSMNEFLPNARCFGDLLEQQGYRLEYMGGANSAFAGKGLFYQSHGFSRVEGLLELQTDPEYVNSWGLYDDTLYDLLAGRFKELSQQAQPFALFSINIGTHQPGGHIARTCEGIRYGKGDNRLLNAAHCTDRLLGKLLERLRKESVLENTLIILASDHLSPPTVATRSILERGERRNLFMIIDPHRIPEKIARPGTTLDIAPTVLGYLGYGSVALALGRDLNGNLPTLRESFGNINIMNQRLLSWRKNIDGTSWGYPLIPSDISVFPQKKQILLGGKKLNYPVLITYDNEGQIEEIWFSNPKSPAKTPAFYLVDTISNTKPFLWVDRCIQIHTLEPSLDYDKNAFCYYNGSLAGKTPHYGKLPEQSSTLMLNPKPAADISIAKAEKLRSKLAEINLIEWDVVNIQRPDLPPLKPVGVVSGGQDSINIPSFMASLEVKPSGLYLVRMNYLFEETKGLIWFSELLTPLDLCLKDNGNIRVSEIMNQYRIKNNHANLFYAIIGNGSDTCGKNAAGRITDLPLMKLSQVKPGSPYIAIFDNQLKLFYEKVGESPQRAIGVSVNTNMPDD